MDLCLGLTLSAREVGLAVVSREHLVRDGVMNLKKLPSDAGKERRFQQVMVGLLDEFRPGHLSIIRPPLPSQARPLIRTERLFLQTEAARRGIVFRELDPEEVKRTLVPRQARATLRELAAELARRFPELRPRSPLETQPPGALHLPELADRTRRVRTDKERYWSRMFLALGGAVHTLEEDLKQRLLS